MPDGAVKVDGKGKYLMPGLGELHAHIPGGKAPDADVERTLFLYVANGVTTIRGMLGHPRHLVYRERVAKGDVLGPRIYTSGPSFNGNTAKTPDAAAAMVIEQQKAGYDLLKIHPGVPRDAFDAMAAKADELKMPFAGHVPGGRRADARARGEVSKHRSPRRLRRSAGAERLRVADLRRQPRREGGREPDPALSRRRAPPGRGRCPPRSCW